MLSDEVCALEDSRHPNTQLHRRQNNTETLLGAACGCVFSHVLAAPGGQRSHLEGSAHSKGCPFNYLAPIRLVSSFSKPPR